MLERKIQLTTDLNMRLKNEFKFAPGEEKLSLFAYYNVQEKVLMCSTDIEFSIPHAYYLGQIGVIVRAEGVCLLERFLEIFKDYNFIPAEKDGRLYIILF